MSALKELSFPKYKDYEGRDSFPCFTVSRNSQNSWAIDDNHIVVDFNNPMVLVEEFTEHRRIGSRNKTTLNWVIYLYENRLIAIPKNSFVVKDLMD